MDKLELKNGVGKVRGEEKGQNLNNIVGTTLMIEKWTRLMIGRILSLTRLICKLFN